MGAEVLLALNIAAFPEDLPPEVIGEIVRAGAHAVLEAGGVVAGGHTVVDAEPKFGLAVVGRVHPDRILRKAGARPNDAILLTKPLGTGLVSTAIRAGTAAAAHVSVATGWMRKLNLEAARAAVAAGAHAATDVTGFGLIGHALEMADASGVELVFDVDALPILDGALEYAAGGYVPGGTGRNRSAYYERCSFTGDLSPEWLDLVFDPQTSGGLLVAIDPSGVAAFEARLAAAGQPVWRVGTARAGSGVTIQAARKASVGPA
jgi:selenide,water dikinase